MFKKFVKPFLHKTYIRLAQKDSLRVEMFRF